MRTGLFAAAFMAFTALCYFLNPLLKPPLIVGAIGIVILYAIPKTRAIGAVLAPLLASVLVYDSLRIFAQGSLTRLMTKPVVELETALFSTDGHLWVTLLQDHTFVFLDVLSGLVYANHATMIIITGLVIMALSGKTRDRAAVYFWAFLALNLAANIIQIIFPVAPPWYVDLHGLTAPTLVPISNAAGLVRFDQAIGQSYFANLYGTASYPMGAMPSLHVAFAVWTPLFARGIWRWPLGIFAVATAFFAVYTNHHYIIDVIAGTGFAVGCYLLFTKTKLESAVIAAHRFAIGADNA